MRAADGVRPAVKLHTFCPPNDKGQANFDDGFSSTGNAPFSPLIHAPPTIA